MPRHRPHLLALVVLVGIGISAAQIAVPAQGASTIQRGAEIAPVPLNMRGLNAALVREDSYIVNA